MKYAYLDSEIKDHLESNPYVSNTQLATMLADLYEDVSIEGLRKHIARLRRSNLVTTKIEYDKNGNVHKRIKSVRNTDTVEVPANFAIKSITQLGDGRQNVKYALADTLSIDAIQEQLKSAFADVVSDPSDVFDAHPTHTKTNDLTLCIYTSDKHIGSATVSNDMYQNTLSQSQKMDSVLKRVMQYKARYGRFKRVIYFDLGDALDGFNAQTTRGGHTLEQDADNRKQFEILLKTECKFIKSLVHHDIAESYQIEVTTNDNHAGDFAYISWYSVMLAVKHFAPFVQFNLNTDFLNLCEVGNHVIVYTHGKDMKHRKKGLPYALDASTEIYVKEWLLEQSCNARNVRLVKGDLHRAGLTEGKFFDYINVGCMIGVTGWSAMNFGKTKSRAYIEVFDENSDTYATEHLVID